MGYKNILVHLDESDRCGDRLGVALRLAQSCGATVTGLFAQSENSGPSLVARRASDHLLAAAQRVREVFEAAAADAGVTARWWQLSHGEYGHVIGETVICARYTDLVVLGQHEQGGDNRVPPSLVEEVLLNAGRPVLVVPFAGQFPVVGERVIIAWNASREAARAVNDAIPVMKHAKSVLVLALHPPRDTVADSGEVPQVDILEHLASHGIEAKRERMTVQNILPMDAVLSRASDEGSDLLVMGGFGGYSAGAFPLFNRGSNTRHILRQMTIPVLMSH